MDVTSLNYVLVSRLTIIDVFLHHLKQRSHLRTGVLYLASLAWECQLFSVSFPLQVSKPCVYWCFGVLDPLQRWNKGTAGVLFLGGGTGFLQQPEAGSHG